jgi:hypothetical protein
MKMKISQKKQLKKSKTIMKIKLMAFQKKKLKKIIKMIKAHLKLKLKI